MKKFDLIVIGAGRASNLALKAGKAGLKVALIEESKLGGTCPNRGCVPSKLLIGYANTARAIKEASRHYIDANINSIDIEQIFEHTNNYVSTIDPVYEKRLKDHVTLFRGKGSFVSNKVIKVNDEELTATSIVIATGSKTIKASHEKAWTSNDMFPFKNKIPKSITIVGSGFIACELANFFDAINIETTLISRSDTLLKNEDEDIQKIFKKEFCKNVKTLFNTNIKDVSYEENSGFSLSLTNDKEFVHTSEALLYATGRQSNASALNIENTSIELDERGFIKRDEFMETSVKDVYVVGDASGKYMLQHAAAYETNHLAKNLIEKEKTALVFKYMPHAVFTDPEISSVGLSEKQIKEENIPYVKCELSWLASAKAMSTKLTYPRTKFLVNPATYEILGCHLIGPDSATLMHQILAVMHIDNDIRHLKEMLYIHPALSEALLPAAVEAVKAVEDYNNNN